MNAVAQSIIARVFSFLPATIAILLTSRLIVKDLGIGAYDAFSLIIGLTALIPLNNLGAGASVTSVYATDGPRSDRGKRVLLTSVRVLGISMVLTAAASIALGVTRAWPHVLGGASGPNAYMAIAVVVYATTFVPGLGQSMLLGVHRNHVALWLQTTFAPLMLAGAYIVIKAKLPIGWIAVVPPAALLVVNVIVASTAGRIAHVRWRRVFRRAWRPQVYPGESIRSLSLPFVVIQVSTSLALQSDRIVLSHVSTAQAVAKYAVIMQLLGPVLAIFATAAQPLWPIWAQAHSRGERGPSLAKVLAAFFLVGIVVGVGTAAIAGPIGHLIGGHQTDLGVLIPLSAVFASLVAALSFPLSMALMDTHGVRFMALCALLALPANLGLSIVLGQHLGASGPLLASVIAAVPLQIVPGIWYSAMPMRRRHFAATPSYAPRHRLARRS